MPSAERLALNEQIFRSVNDQIAALSSTATAPEAPGFVCECSHMDCTETLPLSLAAYTQVRSQPGRYVVVPGHQLDASIERIVTAHDEFLVVEKRHDRT